MHMKCSVMMYTELAILVFLVYPTSISGSELYPSIHWFFQNPLFTTDGGNCGHGPRELKVRLQSKLIFICPNTATVLRTSLTVVQTAIMYENLWLLYNKTAFDECDSSLDPGSRLLLHCNTPTYLAYFAIIFAEFGADPDGLRFQGGRTYYLIATSDGTKSRINPTRGGHCNDESNSITMKIRVYVCKKGNLTYQDPECQSGVGKLRCPTVTSASPSTVPPTSTTRPSVNDTEGKCSDSADNQARVWIIIAVFFIGIFSLHWNDCLHQL